MAIDTICTRDPYDYIVFYRWLSPDGIFERGRIMARLLVEMIEKNRHRIWLDQREMDRRTAPKQVVQRIADAFTMTSQVIILAAPGDWHRFVNAEDIHRWEWEISLKSDKKVWLLQYGSPEGTEPLSIEELAVSLGIYNPKLADLARRKAIRVRVLSMDNIDGVVKEIVEADKSVMDENDRRLV